LQKRERLDAARAALYVFFGFDHADEATALRTHSVGGRKTFSPVQTQRSHCGWVERYLEVQSQALSVRVSAHCDHPDRSIVITRIGPS